MTLRVMKRGAQFNSVKRATGLLSEVFPLKMNLQVLGNLMSRADNLRLLLYRKLLLIFWGLFLVPRGSVSKSSLRVLKRVLIWTNRHALKGITLSLLSNRKYLQLHLVKRQVIFLLNSKEIISGHLLLIVLLGTLTLDLLLDDLREAHLLLIKLCNGPIGPLVTLLNRALNPLL